MGECRGQPSFYSSRITPQCASLCTSAFLHLDLGDSNIVLMPRTSHRPSVLTPSATDTMLLFWRTLIGASQSPSVGPPSNGSTVIDEQPRHSAIRDVGQPYRVRRPSTERVETLSTKASWTAAGSVFSAIRRDFRKHENEGPAAVGMTLAGVFGGDALRLHR